MEKYSMAFIFMLISVGVRSMAGPIESEKSPNDDLTTSESFGYGYYQPDVRSTPLLATGFPLATTTAIAAPLTTDTTSGGFRRSGYGYGSGYKYGSGYDFGKHWNYGSGSAVNEFYRRHPIYVAWG